MIKLKNSGIFDHLPRFSLDLDNLPHFTCPLIICHTLHSFLSNLPYFYFYRFIHFCNYNIHQEIQYKYRSWLELSWLGPNRFVAGRCTYPPSWTDRASSPCAVSMPIDFSATHAWSAMLEITLAVDEQL
jgi:hypothetical protein